MEAVFTVLGFLAGFLTTLAFVPQALHSWRTKSAGDFSWAMLITFSIGVTLWFVYGIHIHSWPMILANFATFLLIVPIIVIKLRHPDRARRPGTQH